MLQALALGLRKFYSYMYPLQAYLSRIKLMTQKLLVNCPNIKRCKEFQWFSSCYMHRPIHGRKAGWIE
jgi:hypothetical protein